MAIDPNLLGFLISQLQQVSDDKDDLGDIPRSGEDLFDLGETGDGLKGLTRETPWRWLPDELDNLDLQKKVGPGMEGWNPRLPSRAPLPWTWAMPYQGGTSTGHRSGPKQTYKEVDQHLQDMKRMTYFAQYGQEGSISPYPSQSSDLEELMGIARRGADLKSFGPPGSGWHEAGYLAGPEDEYQRRKYNDEGQELVRRSQRRMLLGPEAKDWSPERMEEYLSWKSAELLKLEKLNRENPDSDLNKMMQRNWRYGDQPVRVEWVNGKPTEVRVLKDWNDEPQDVGPPQDRTERSWRTFQ